MTTAADRRVERYRSSIGENWGWMAARGVFSILFGVFALAWPGVTLLALIFVFGAYALIDGLAELGVVARGGRTATGKMWPLVLVGLVGIGAGIAAFVWPQTTSMVLLYIISIWAIARGVFEMAAYFSLRKEVDNAWLIMTSGLLSVIFGVLLTVSPVAGVLAVLWLVGLYAIIVGGVLLALAFSMRQSKKVPVEPRGGPPIEPTPA